MFEVKTLSKYFMRGGKFKIEFSNQRILEFRHSTCISHDTIPMSFALKSQTFCLRFVKKVKFYKILLIRRRNILHITVEPRYLFLFLRENDQKRNCPSIKNSEFFNMQIRLVILSFF